MGLCLDMISQAQYGHQHPMTPNQQHTFEPKICWDMPVIVRALRRIKPEGSHAQGAKQKAPNLEPGEVHKCQHLAIQRASARRWKKRWSDRGLQVDDLKVAGALSCSYVIGADRTGSQRIKLAPPCMNHAPSRGCCRALSAVGE